MTWRISAIAWAAAIGVVSLLPAERALVSGLWDKLEHAAAFAVLAVFIRLAWRRIHSLAIFFMVTIYGGLIELAQFFSPGRFPDPWDGLANAVGGLCALMIVHLWLGLQPSRNDQNVISSGSE